MPTVDFCGYKCGYEMVIGISAIACIVGLLLLPNHQELKTEAQETEAALLKMTFSYWLVYCVAFTVEKMFLPLAEVLIISLKITTALSYFLTFSCILSLPLYKFAVHDED
jgi:hypothetical protein